MMGIVSIGSKLLKTVGLLAVRPEMAKLRLKKHPFEKCENTFSEK